MLPAIGRRSVDRPEPPAYCPAVWRRARAGTRRHFRHSYTKDRRELVNRLRRIEGQARGIQRLVEEEAYCLDVLQQVEALTAAADQVGLLLLEDHIDGCLTHAIETGPGAAVRRRGDDRRAAHDGPPRAAASSRTGD